MRTRSATPIFSSRRCNLRVHRMGTTKGCCASSRPGRLGLGSPLSARRSGGAKNERLISGHRHGLNHRKTEFHSSLFEPIGNKRNRPIIRRPGIDIDGSLPAKKLGDRFGLAADSRNEAQLNLLIGGVIARRHRVFVIGNINHPVAIGETCGNQQLAASFTICVALTPSTAIR